MPFRAYVAVFAAAVLVLPARPIAQSKGKAQTRQVYVSVVDRFGSPVSDLQPADVEVTEGGVKRDIVRVGLAKSPMRIMVMVDTSDAMAQGINHLRAGLAAFGEGIGPQHELGLVVTGPHVRVRVPPSADHKKFLDAAKGLFTESGATVLSDGLMEIDDRFMKNAEDRWPIFVIVTGDGAEASSPANEKKFNEWLRALPGRGVGVHALVMKFKGGGLPEAIASHVTTTAAGHYDYMNTSNTMPEKLKALAELIMKQFELASTKWEVTYTSDAKATGEVIVGIARPGVKFQTTQTRLR